jgi:hypothetical protein
MHPLAVLRADLELNNGVLTTLKVCTGTITHHHRTFVVPAPNSEFGGKTILVLLRNKINKPLEGIDVIKALFAPHACGFIL